ncbi:hypothetical protein HDU80_005476 [Chytriomyces hyalinus]|nr:hypothetical protein HDU80_005476 [Chytriomyces hyalinus]
MKSLIALLLPLCLSTLVAARVSFAPYIDATTSFDPVAYHTLTGTMEFSLGFVTAGPGNGPPQWNGNLVSSGYYKGQIAAIRAFGGDIRISFGGAANQELALAASDATTLANTYIQVLQTYSATYADFDIEGGAVKNRANVDLRNQALAKVQAALPSLKISYTLPVSTGGLTDDGIYLVQSAAKYNVKIDCLNIMAMDYYENIPYKDSNGNSLMGQYAIASTKATYKQVGTLVQSIGITPMIGVNDDVNEVFTLADAAQVAAFAASTSYVSMVSFWVVAADSNGSYAKTILAGLAGGATTKTSTPASTTASSIAPSSVTSAPPVTTASGTCFPAYNPSIAYSGQSKVSYNGVNYINTWYEGAGWVPGPGVSPSDGGWVSQGACGTSATVVTLPQSTLTSASAASTVMTSAKPSTTTSKSSGTVLATLPAALTHHSVAVIGGGAAGASAALFMRGDICLRRSLRMNSTEKTDAGFNALNLTLFESSHSLGGRARVESIRVHDGEEIQVEIGASIFSASNKHLMDAVKRYNLTLQSSLKSSSDVRAGLDMLGIHDGESFIFTAGEDSLFETIGKVAWRWGLVSPYRARALALSAAALFENSYVLKSNRQLGFESVAKLFQQGLKMDSEVLTKSAQDYFSSHGVSSSFVTELIEPLVRVNYGQNIDINAIAALVCLKAAFAPTDAVVGGNKLIFENMVKESQADVKLDTRVSQVQKLKDGRYELTDSVGNSLGVFHDVIVAVPSVKGKEQIKFVNTQRASTPIPYVHLHVTFVLGTMNPSFFNSKAPLPAGILTTASSNLGFNAIGTRYVSRSNANVTLTKIFSQSSMTDAVLASLYTFVESVDRFEWDAYPVLEPLHEKQDAWMMLDEAVREDGSHGGLYHVNAFESAFSAMEGETVAAANVVQLMMHRWETETENDNMHEL